VTLAVVVRPRGRIGEVAAQILTDFPERLTRLKEVFLQRDAAAGRPRRPGAAPLPAIESRRIRVRRCWLHQDQAVFHFEGIGSMNEAETLVGCEVQVPLSGRATLPHGQFWVTDLVGCEVHEPGVLAGATLLGAVRDVQLDTGTPVLAVDTPQGELLIPLAEEICTRIDPAARRIEVRLPEGLRDLNRR
jgi:16S rRNA processing protein RimM